MKTACFFGIYDPDYSRNRVLMRGFRQNGWKVVECRADPRIYRGFSKYIRLIRAYAGLKPKKPDLVIVAFPGQTVVWLARLLFGKDILFDAFLSLYDSNVRDRKLYSRRSPRGMRDFFLDWYSVRLPRFVLLDTNEHIAYFASTFRVPAWRFKRALIGADDSVFFERKAAGDIFGDAAERGRGNDFVVEFHGTFIPLQGVEFVVQAAAMLAAEGVRFDLIGSGQTLESAKRLVSDLGLANVRFLGKVPFDRLPEYIAGADACIGIVGATDKAGRVIPNKVYECAAVGKPIMTADSPAVREVFSDGKDAIFCQAADPSSLADKIRLLKREARLRDSLSRAAAETFKRQCSPAAIVAKLLIDLGA